MKRIILLLITAAIFAGCKKSSNTDNQTPTEKAVKVSFQFTINGWRDEPCYVKFTDKEEKKYDSGMGVTILESFEVGKTITVSARTESNRDIEIRINGGRTGHYVITNKSGTGTVSITFNVE